jgi:hypothetical protein
MHTRCVLMLTGWLAIVSLPALAGSDWTKVAEMLGNLARRCPAESTASVYPGPTYRSPSMAWHLSQR